MTDRRSEVRDAYDDIAAPYTAERSESPPELSMLCDLFSDLPPDAHVLDAGCGAGDPVAAFLVERFAVTGLDFSTVQLALARDRVPDATLVLGDMTALPFEDGTFDGLCSIYAVIHVPRERHRDCFAEFRRVLRPGAPLLLTVGTTEWTGSTEDWMGLGAKMHWDVPGRDRTTDCLEAVGFQVEACDAIPDDVSEDDGEKLFVRARAPT